MLGRPVGPETRAMMSRFLAFQFKIYKGQKRDIVTWRSFSLVAPRMVPGKSSHRQKGLRDWARFVLPGAVKTRRACVTGLVLSCQVQSKRDFLRKCVPKQCTAPRLEQHSWYFGHIMTQKLLPGTVKTICPYTLATGQSTAPRQEPHSCCCL